MSERKYYCFCDANCRFETMTKEQILAAIAQAAEGELPLDPDAAFVTQIVDQHRNRPTKIWRGTEAEFNAFHASNPLDADCLYMLTDSVGVFGRESKNTGGSEELGAHVADMNNPHGVTAAQVGALTMELLWENASPTSAFAAQTIALDLAAFAGVFITYRNQTGGSVYNTTGFVGKGDGFALIYVPSVSSSVAVTRKGTVNANGVEFLANSNDNNNYHIPLKIYGIKGAIA